MAWVRVFRLASVPLPTLGGTSHSDWHSDRWRGCCCYSICMRHRRPAFVNAEPHCIQFLWVVISFGHRSLYIIFLSQFVLVLGLVLLFHSTIYILSSLHFWTMLHTNFIRSATHCCGHHRHRRVLVVHDDDAVLIIISGRLLHLSWCVENLILGTIKYRVIGYGSENRLIMCALALTHWDPLGPRHCALFMCISFYTC